MGVPWDVERGNWEGEECMEEECEEGEEAGSLKVGMGERAGVREGEPWTWT